MSRIVSYGKNANGLEEDYAIMNNLICILNFMIKGDPNGYKISGFYEGKYLKMDN